MKPSHWNDIGQDPQDLFAVDAKWITAKFAGAVRENVHEFQSLKGEKRNGGINQKEKKEQEEFFQNGKRIKGLFLSLSDEKDYKKVNRFKKN